MEKFALFVINTFLSVLVTMFIFCKLLQLQFSMVYVILETLFLILICYNWPKFRSKK
jgi:hypothetical protein